jgi:hypothetical protein
MKNFVSRHLAGVGNYIASVSGSTGDYDLTLVDGTVYEGYDETANSFGTAAPGRGDLCLFGTDGATRRIGSADVDVLPLEIANQFLRIKDTSAPTAVLSPLDEAEDVAITANITLTFNKDVSIATAASIVLADVATSTPVDCTNSVSGHVVTINPDASLTNEEVYDITILADAIADMAGNLYAGSVTTFTCVASG